VLCKGGWWWGCCCVKGNAGGGGGGGVCLGASCCCLFVQMGPENKCQAHNLTIRHPHPTHPPTPPPRHQVRHPADGGDAYMPCAPGAPGSQEVTLQHFADKGLADRVLPPTISRIDFDKVGLGFRGGAGGAVF